MGDRFSDKTFYQLAESSPDAIFIATQGSFVYVNPAAIKLFGATDASELLNTPVIERIHPEQREIIGKRMQLLYQEHKAAPLIEEIYLRLDGTPVDVEVAAVPFDLNGENSGLVFVRNITLRKRAEEELQLLNQSLEQRVEERTCELFAKESELKQAFALNENILASTDVGIAVFRQDGQCILCNPGLAAITSGTQEQLLQQNFRTLPSWETSGLITTAERVFGSGQTEHHEIHVTTSFGKTLYMRYHLSRLDKDGEPHLLIMVQDISEQKQAAQDLAKREREFRTLAENVPGNIVRTDLEGRALFFNESMRQMLGQDTSPLLGKTADESFPDGRFKQMTEAFKRVGQSGEDEELEMEIKLPDGSTAYHLLHLTAERGDDGNPLSVLAVGRDITAQRIAEEELQLAASVFHNSAEGVIITDAESQILSVNPAFSEITGYSEAEALGQSPSMLRSDRHGHDFYRDMWHSLTDKGRWQGEIWNRRKDGETYLEWLTINRIDDNNGKPIRYVAVFHDITELHRKDERIRHLAFHDALTDLPNRTLFQDRLQHALDRAKREGSRLSVTFIDLDRFKAVNDSLGHDIGDLMLQQVAHRISRQLRVVDTVARLGGDEFVVLMENLHDSGTCAMMAETLILEISRPMELHGHRIQTSASMGMAFFPEDGNDPLELMKRADMAMYAAKSAGRNTYRFFQPQMLERTSKRLGMEMELRRAIVNADLVLHYQPKVNLATGKPVGAEALIRWQHPEHGLLPPNEFIPLAEECGLIQDIGKWVIAESCRQTAEWKTNGIRTRIALNVSSHQLVNEELVSFIKQQLQQHDISAEDIELELTESAVMDNPEQAAGVFARLREIGVSIAIDDFGTGYSSLAYLRRLPIDVLKIDRSFVRDADRNEEDAQIVKTILALGKSLGLIVVAEGIESAAQATLLRQMGCDRAQGYYFARPLPANEFNLWWKERID